MSRQLTITVSDEVYFGLQSAVGDQSVDEFIAELARPFLAQAGLEDAYREMSLDADRENEAPSGRKA